MDDEHGEKGEKGERGPRGYTGDPGTPCQDDHDLLIRIGGKLDTALAQIADHECRIRDIQGNQLKVLGAGAVTGFITGWLSRFFGGGAS